MTSDQTKDKHQPLLSHVSIGVSDIKESVRFYDNVMLTLGCEKIVDYETGAAYGRGGLPSFWIQIPIDGAPAAAGNGSHVSFSADSVEMVNRFHATAIAEGGKNEGAPGYRKSFSEAFYTAFARDLDGHKIEAMFWDLSKL